MHRACLGGRRGGRAALLSDYYRHSASPGAVRAINLMTMDIDVRHVLSAIRVPTLLLHGQDDHLPIGPHAGGGRIPAARLDRVSGGHPPPVGEALAAACDEIE